MSRFFRTLAATPLPSLTSPKRMCSVPMYSWLKRWASWLANCITFRARSVNRSYIYAVSHGGMELLPSSEPCAHHIHARGRVQPGCGRLERPESGSVAAGRERWPASAVGPSKEPGQDEAREPAEF